MIGSMVNFEDINQTTIYIPYSGPDDDSDTPSDIPFPAPPLKERDFLDGHELRLKAYRVAWDKCLTRVQSIVKTLHAPVVSDVAMQVQESYSKVLPGLPYPELPVFCVTNLSGSTSFLNDVSKCLEVDAGVSEGQASTFAVHLHPSDCANVSNGMKAIITGFIERDSGLDQVKHRPATSLANFDINLLVAWYKALKETATYSSAPPKLVLILHDFEQFDPATMQDIFYILRYVPSPFFPYSLISLSCSGKALQLPLVFILLLSTPPIPSYLQTTYPHSTLSLLRITHCVVPSGPKVLEEVLLKTFFDIEFEPCVFIGPAILEYLMDYFTRYNSSIDGLITTLQISYLKHFTSEPMSLLVLETPSVNYFSEADAFSLLDALLTRLLAPSEQSPSSTDASDWQEQSIPSLVKLMDETRAQFYVHSLKFRLGFRILLIIQGFMTKQGYKGLNWDEGSTGSGLCDVMVDALRGNLTRDVKYLGTMVKKFKVQQLHSLLNELHPYFRDMPTHVRVQVEAAWTKIIFLRNTLPKNDDDASTAGKEAVSEFGEWLIEYLNDLILPLDESLLWDVWYTGNSTFPSEVINPSVRASLLSGLLRPLEFGDSSLAENDAQQDTETLWQLPDTNILFRRYLDSGKMINIYDWLESFQAVLDTQKEELKNVGDVPAKGSRSKIGANGKGKKKQVSADEDDEEKWKVEVQARFMRALHELDYLGFIKHTGRKPDHVMRTVFNVTD
ncbi:origin recognition complex subunit 3 N-terminus-domain-containing protein [Crucibulum laeve]|uniref:Origin recognition complex subunit 3 N-terminus-domain-containing protein n=1 Tax=Crucibulum laeve TaxID=68775 RepID=A0A5C3LYX5_9AGAR|nr:origin recognition complex subunit 3 N-terminus-domain-containing protein [Crucibulum laeve]